MRAPAHPRDPRDPRYARGVFAPRIARLRALLARAARPGGMYPAFVLAARDLGADERAAMDAVLAASPLAPAWAEWSRAQRSTAARAFALGAIEPAFAHVHLLLADLSSRDADAHAEPDPELRAALAARDAALAAAYGVLLERLVGEFDSGSEYHAASRGFGYHARAAVALLRSPDERACFARGSCAWSPDQRPAVGDELPRGELVESALDHAPDGVTGTFGAPAELAALECPELLTAVLLCATNPRADLALLARSPHLRRLSLVAPTLAGGPDEARALATLPIEQLSLTLPATNPPAYPDWIAALPRLRALAINYSDRGTSGGAVDPPDALCELPALEHLDLSGVRTLPDRLGRLAALQTLRVFGLHLTALPPALGELARLERLTVDPALALAGLPEGFERLRALRFVRLGHLTTPEVPRALFRMPWLRTVQLVSARRWPASEAEALRRALPDAQISIAFTGNAVG